MSLITEQSQLSTEGQEREKHQSAPSSSEALLVFERVSKWYGSVLGLNKVSLELRAGITGLVGANGAGKSTLMRLATGQMSPDDGRIEICGHDSRSTTARWHVGYSPEVDTFYEEMSGRRFILTLARLCGLTRRQAKNRTEQVLKLVGMESAGDRRIKGYSKGMRQRVKLAQALLHNPQTLILDEPFSGIDPLGRVELSRLFHKLADMGKCLLVSSHQLQELEKLTSQVVIMSAGRIAAVGTISEIRSRLANHPATLRIDLLAGGNARKIREVASTLALEPSVLGLEIQEVSPWQNDLSTLQVTTINVELVRQKVSELVREEWLELVRMELIDTRASSVLNSILGGST